MSINKEQKQRTALSVLSEVTYEAFVDDIVEQVTERILERLTQSEQLDAYLTAQDVAKMLRISPRTLDKRIAEGQLPEPIQGGGRGSKRLWSSSQFYPKCADF